MTMRWHPEKKTREGLLSVGDMNRECCMGPRPPNSVGRIPHLETLGAPWNK